MFRGNKMCFAFLPIQNSNIIRRNYPLFDKYVSCDLLSKYTLPYIEFTAILLFSMISNKIQIPNFKKCRHIFADTE